MGACYSFRYCLALCLLWLLVGCSNDSSSSSSRGPQFPKLALTSYETQILVGWENPAQANATLNSIVLRWTVLNSTGESTNITIGTNNKLVMGSQQTLIEGLTNNTRYQVEMIGYYQRLEQICNSDCNICYTAQRRLDEYYQLVLGRGMVTTGNNPDSSLDYEEAPPPSPPDNKGKDQDEGADTDGDGTGDRLDPDDDGNGLIEVTTPAEFYNIRYALDGSGKAIEEEESSISLITSGCEGEGGTIGCYGYELMANISLAELPADDWTPFALDEDNAHFPVIATSFSGRFDGRGHSITNLSISQSGASCVGLFGNLEDAKISNLTLTFTHIEGGSQVASLVGRGENVTIKDISIEGKTIEGDNMAIGGLVGYGNLISISHSDTHIEELSGVMSVGGLAGSLLNGEVEDSHTNVSVVTASIGIAGGLIGAAPRSSVIASSAYSDQIRVAVTAVGGLLGDGFDARVVASSALSGSIGLSSASRAGGLIGDGRYARVYNSSASNGNVIGFRDVGGLIGSGHYATVNHSFATKELVQAYEDSGGLMGDGEFSRVSHSYALVETILAQRESGGLIGDAENARISSSYAEFDLVESVEAAGGLVADGEGTRLFGVRAKGNWVRSFDDWAGGLMGFAPRIRLEDSYAQVEVVSGRIAAGLVGQGNELSISHSSYNGSIVYALEKVGGLLGVGASPRVYNSTARVNIVIADGQAGGLIGEGLHSNINASAAHTQLVYSEEQGSGGLVGSMGEGEGNVIVDSYANNSVLCGKIVGGLVGVGEDLLIRHSYALSGNLCNAELAGGLIGLGDKGRVISSYAETGMIAAANEAGGLLGGGDQAIIRSSYAISETINASSAAGGLIGYGDDSIVLTSYALVNRLAGGSIVGGILAQGDNSRLVSSYAMANLIVSDEAATIAREGIGALIGESLNASIVSSYAVVGPLIKRGLIGADNDTNKGIISASYWDLNVSQIDSDDDGDGVVNLTGLMLDEFAKTTRQLRQPTDYTGIYSSWANTSVSFNRPQLDDGLARWCDIDESGYIEEEERSSANLLWDFGNSSEYPALHCVVGGLSKQRGIRYFPVAFPSFLFDSPAPGSDDNESALPKEPLSDPLIERQWYLDAIGIKELWAENLTGEGVDVSIVDDALDFTHPDLIPNILIDQSRNFLEEDPLHPDYRLPEPIYEDEDGHGTSVAGIIAARGDNDIGIKGVAPRAKIYLSNLLQVPISSHIMEALEPRTNKTLVVSNSWGAIAVSRLVAARETFNLVVEANLEGKGVNYVFSAGNTRGRGDMASYEERLNHRGVITVCATGMDNRSLSYSNFGPNLWLCAPSGSREGICQPSFLSENINTDTSQCGIATTDLVSGGYNTNRSDFQPGALIIPPRLRDMRFSPWDFGGGDFFGVDGARLSYLEPIGGGREYHRFFSGTSASVPIVSGVIAVLRSAYRQLSWRDIKLILAESARKVNLEDASWQPGASGYANASHFYNHSIYYGFGLIDAAKANQLAKNWKPLPEPKTPYSAPERILRPSDDSGSIHITTQDQDISFIEWTEMDIKSEQQNFHQVELVLVSPRGTRSLLTQVHPCIRTLFFSSVCSVPEGFTFATAANLGQAAEGVWRLEAKGLSSDLKWRLRFRGH